MLECLVSTTEISKIIFNHSIYEKAIHGLYEPFLKVRTQSLKFFIRLFSSDYYQTMNVILPAMILKSITEGIDMSPNAEITLRYLNLIEKIFNLNSFCENLKVSLEFSILYEKLEELVYDKNKDVFIHAVTLLDILESSGPFEDNRINKLFLF